MHFGIISPPVSGHIHPFGALGRGLIARGHRVTLLHMEDLRGRAQAEGLEFAALGGTDHPPGKLAHSLARLGKLHGLAALRFTIGEVKHTTNMMLRDAPDAIRRLGIAALLVDQTEPAGATLAAQARIPFVTVCNALLLNREDTIPPAFSSWNFAAGAWPRLRNRFGYWLSDRTVRPVTQVVAQYRKRWNLSELARPEASFSPLAQIAQQPAAFDFPRSSAPSTLHYVGPLRGASLRPVPFPWERLDGRPLVYASLGTLQNGKEQVFRIFAEACRHFPVQLVITHGGGLDEQTASSFPGNPVVVPYAPQLEVLARASLTLTHAGLNTVLDSLSYGVPLVAVPITYEQPAIAKRVEWSGVGKAIPFRKLSLERVKGAIREVLDTPSFVERARVVQESIARAGGVTRASEIIEQAVSTTP